MHKKRKKDKKKSDLITTAAGEGGAWCQCDWCSCRPTGCGDVGSSSIFSGYIPRLGTGSSKLQLYNTLMMLLGEGKRLLECSPIIRLTLF